MIVGVPKEIKNKENRVGMVIAGVRALTTGGHKVLVNNAGMGVGISDEEYQKQVRPLSTPRRRSSPRPT